MAPLDTELEGFADLVLPHRDVNAMGKPWVHAVEDDALAVSFDVQDRLRVDEVRGTNLKPLSDEAAEVLSRCPDARLVACLPLHPDVVGGHFPDEPGNRVIDESERTAGGHDPRPGPRSDRSRHVDFGSYPQESHGN